MPKQTSPLDAERIRAELAGTRFADVRYAAQTQSTNVDAQSLLGSTQTLGTTIVADYQTAGAGRKGRRWFAPPGAALLFTTILPQPISTAALWAVPFWIAVHVADAVQADTGVALDLVWPNDLFVHGGKTGGILSVARIAGDDAWVGCGVGLNVHRPLGDPDLDALRPQPVFLDACAVDVEREALLVHILRAFDRGFGELRDPTQVARQWERRANLAGTIYRYRNDADGIERVGTALRIGSQGALIVRDAAAERPIDMADVRITGRARD